jgi:hypothetical protein
MKYEGMWFTFQIDNYKDLPQDGQRIISLLENECMKMHVKNYVAAMKAVTMNTKTYEAFCDYCKKEGTYPPWTKVVYLKEYEK